MRHLHSWTMVSALGLALALSACGDDGGTSDETTNGTTDGTATGTSTSTSTSTTTDDTSTSTTTTGVDTGTDTGTDTGVDTGTGDTGEDTGTGTGGSVCDPEQDDDDCAMCTKSMCCDQLEACYADEDCACLVTCVNAGMDLATCQSEEQCNVATLPAPAGPLLGCTTNMCPACEV